MNPYDEWSNRLLNEREVMLRLVQFLRNRGLDHGQAIQAAPDAVQEGLLTVMQKEFAHWESYRHFRNAVLWAARHRLTDEYRHTSRLGTRTGDDHTLANIPTREPAAISWFVEECLQHLSPEEGDVIRALYEEGLTLREFAERLPPDDRTQSGRIGEVFRARRTALARLRRMLLEDE